MSDTTDLINKGLKDEKNLAKINKKAKKIRKEVVNATQIFH